MANYRVEGKKVIAKVAKLTDNEMKAVQKYLALGFTLEEEKAKEPVERLNDTYIKKYLANDEKGLAKYEEIKNEDVIDDNGDVVYHIINKGKENQRNGEKMKNTMGAFQWFKENYPEEVEDIAGQIAKKKIDIDKMYNEYVAKKKKDKNGNIIEDRQSKDVYIRCYYWNHIFQIKKK